MSALFNSSRSFRLTVIFTVICFTTLTVLVVYGILILRPDQIAVKQDVTRAQAALEARLNVEDRKQERQHAELMKRLKAAIKRQVEMKKQQDANLRTLREMKEKLK